ncbi:chloramphenicol acetyltransferase [Marivirga sp. S37H4]|uniref:Chloramphenicol acetyltransferase n=1 Tax=Marivirga aurantiaca TaxID=2802615 RepID=A0A935C9Y9_9BACT|nr:CatB-related O-acetyltransferase [Marivirga aurantiaca]MBK6264523.1 chloramphenicol acetyltransferase [Marivirga aurantiaca]
MIRLLQRIINKVSNLNTLEGQIRIDKNVIIRSSKCIGEVSIGENSKVINTNLLGKVSIGKHCKLLNAELTGEVVLGRYTSIAGQGTTISSQFHPITIGSFCSIASNCTILEFNHPISKLSTYYINKHIFNESSPENDRESKGEIVVGNDVWIGANVVILSGVKIGNGAIIGSNAIVSKDIPPYAVVGGIPAKIIKYRFEQNIISKLNRLAWWDWPLEKIIDHKALFTKKSLELEDLNNL